MNWKAGVARRHEGVVGTEGCGCDCRRETWLTEVGCEGKDLDEMRGHGFEGRETSGEEDPRKNE